MKKVPAGWEHLKHLLVDVADAFNTVRDEYAKSANFLIAYGGGANTLARNIGCSYNAAKTIIDTVFATYPRLRPWQEEVVELAKVQGYVSTAYGTRKHATPNLFSSDNGLVSREGRQLVNHYPQGTAADILKVVLKNCHDERILGPRSEYGKRAVLVLPLYDETLCSVEAEVAVEFAQRLMGCLQVTPPGHKIPMMPELDLGLDNFLPANAIEFGAKPDWDKFAEAVAMKVPSKARFYLPTWHLERGPV